MKILYTLLCTCLILATSCKKKEKESTPETEVQEETTNAAAETSAKKAKAVIQGKSGTETSGSVTFKEENGMVEMTALLSNISKSGKHAIHIHAKGDCSSDDGKSAGGHWNPTDHDHGEWGEGSFHIGDIGNLEIDEKGNGIISKKTDLWCIGCGDPNKDIIGKAIIIHAGADDMTSQPSGAAGARIGCAEIVLAQ